MFVNRYIFLLLLMPIACYSQNSNIKQKLDKAMNKTKRQVILPSGDTIYTTNNRTRLLTKEDMEFFSRDTLNIDALNKYLYTGNTKYRSLEDATNSISGLIDTIKEEQDKKAKNQSLSFRLSQKNRDQLNKERKAEAEWEKRKVEESLKLSVNDLVNLYEKYGDKPTYYINGVIVDESVVNQLRQSDILSRQFKTNNTASNNPNGEIWVEVPIPVAQNILPDNTASSRGLIDTKHIYKNESAQNEQNKTSIKPITSPDNYYNSVEREKSPNVSHKKNGSDEDYKKGNSIISKRKSANRPDLNVSGQVPNRSNNKSTNVQTKNNLKKEHPQNSSNKPVTLNLKGGKRR